VDFDLTEEQKEIKKAADGFAKGEFDKEVILTWSETTHFLLPS
jgi:hypothetical protein